MSTLRSASATRETILAAARRLVGQVGPSVTLEDIADEAGVSRQTLYVHFGSRSGLLIALVQHMDESGVLHELLQGVFDAATAAEALDAVANVHAEYHPIAYSVARVFMTGRREDEAIVAAWEERMASRRNLYGGVIDRLDREGQLSPVWNRATATDVILALTSWELWEVLVVDRGWTKSQYLRHLRTLLRRALLDPDDLSRLPQVDAGGVD